MTVRYALEDCFFDNCVIITVKDALKDCLFEKPLTLSRPEDYVAAVSYWYVRLML